MCTLGALWLSHVYCSKRYTTLTSACTRLAHHQSIHDGHRCTLRACNSSIKKKFACPNPYPLSYIDDSELTMFWWLCISVLLSSWYPSPISTLIRLHIVQLKLFLVAYMESMFIHCISLFTSSLVSARKTTLIFNSLLSSQLPPND